MNNFDVLKRITDKDRLDFSQHFSIARPSYVGDTLFPDVKTQNLEAEYERLAEGEQLPVAASVHAFDTETLIGTRPTMERVTLEMLLIKEKIDQGERLARYLQRGVSESEVLRYIYDDMAREAEKVKTRTEVAKMELLSTGKMTITENNLDMVIDYGVPDEHRLDFNWSTDMSAFNPWDDLRKAVRLAEDAGFVIGAAMMSRDNYDILISHPSTQIAVYGTLGVGAMIDDAQLQRVAQNKLGFSRIFVNESKYRVQRDNGVFETHRYFKEDVISFFPVGNRGVGTGLWGVTPEELKMGPWSAKSQQQFITITQWETPDPVTTWTKASGVFIPVYPTIASSLILATVEVGEPEDETPTP